MNFNVIGKIEKVLPVQSGTSTKGDWQKGSFILRTEDQYPSEICMEDFGFKAQSDQYVEGDMVEVTFSIQSKEYNGRYFTTASAFRMKRHGDTPAPVKPVATQQPQARPAQAATPNFAYDPDGDPGSGLPF